VLRLKKRYDGRAFGLLALMLRNSMEAHLAQESPGEHGETHLSLGKKLFADGRLPEAEHELMEACSLLPQSSEPYLVLGQVYEAEGRHQDAAAELKTSLQLDNNAMTHLWLARVYSSMNQSELALEQGRAALSMDPGNPDAERLLDAIRRHSPRGSTP
jgi:Tfp pilus assembly protein PilF